MYFGGVCMCVGEKKCKVDVEECTTSHSAKEGMTRGACDHGFHRSVSNKIYYTVFTVIDFFSFGCTLLICCNSTWRTLRPTLPEEDAGPRLRTSLRERYSREV